MAYKDPAKHRAYSRQYARQHPEKVREIGRASARKRMLAARNMSTDAYAALLLQQRGVCAICHQPETRMQNGRLWELSIDHCHATGRTRGLLCNVCNVTLGFFADNADRFRSAAAYIDAHQE
jgi:hypothetical protein